MAAKAAMAQGAPNYFTAEAMGFILAALFFNTLTAPVVKMTQNAEGGYDYNKWRARGVPLFVSRHRRDSSPSDEVAGGFFFEFEAVRTEPRCSAQVAREFAAVDPASGRWGIAVGGQAR